MDRTLLALTVDKIYIYENKQIKIQIRYQDVIEKMKVIKLLVQKINKKLRQQHLKLKMRTLDMQV